MTKGSVVPSLHIALDPVVDTQVIELVPHIGEVGVGGWETRLLKLLLYDRIDGLKILEHLRCTMVPLAEIGNVLCPPC